MARIADSLVAAIAAVTDRMVSRLQGLVFGPPVSHVYHPLCYARKGYDAYISRFAHAPTPVVMLGMNPGPFGMAQTGVPFGDVSMVSGWMGITAAVAQPVDPHPKRPIHGFDCPRGEVSGQRLWGWAEARFGAADAFFREFFVLNYCPLVFMEASGRNRTPDKLPASERRGLFAICDDALRETIDLLQPRVVVGIGAFAEARARAALPDGELAVGRISHPSPANPNANRGWDRLIEGELAAIGIDAFR